MRASSVLLTALLVLLSVANAAAQTKVAEIKDSGGTTLFQVNTDASLLSLGTFGTGTIPATGVGTRLMWYPAKAAFRAGRVFGTRWDDANIGSYSTAMGFNTMASGNYSTALGSSTTAQAAYSLALGNCNIAAGNNTGWISTDPLLVVGNSPNCGSPSNALTLLKNGNLTAAGVIESESGGFKFPDGTVQTTASGGGLPTNGQGAIDLSDTDGYVAEGTFGLGNMPAQGPGTRMMWYPKKAAFRAGSVGGGHWDAVNTGSYSVALGNNTIANGNYSTAMGFFASTNGKEGSFVYGDRSSTSIMPINTANNQFMVRAAGGTIFYSASNLSSGVTLPSGGGSWLTISDRTKKEHFRDEDGEAVLARIAHLPIQSWNYKTQDEAIRHLGPTAQDFYAAFGLGESDTTITTVDIDGINMLAIQALERRTDALRQALAEVDVLAQARREQQAEIETLKKRLAHLEAMLPTSAASLQSAPKR